MKKLDYEKLHAFIASDVVQPFHETRLKRLESAKFSDLLKQKNPYLFKAKNIETSGDLAKNILDAFLSSQEETMFGRYMEQLAVHICKEVFGGKKAEEGTYKSVDLIFKRDRKIYLVGIKSGPKWGNADQVQAFKENMKRAKKLCRKTEKGEVVAVNGCMYGRDNNPHKIDKRDAELNYDKVCGQSFWEIISGDDNLYKNIIQPLSSEAKERDGIFKDLYGKKINEMTKDIIELFCNNDSIDWGKIIDHVSKHNES